MLPSVFFNHCNAKCISVKRRENIIKFNRNGQECDVSAMSNAVHINANVLSKFTLVICCLMGTNRKYSQEAVHAAGVIVVVWMIPCALPLKQMLAIKK